MPRLSGYRPHFVVGDPARREADPENEDYLGVAFNEGPEEGGAGQELIATVVLLYFPLKDYSALAPGTTFTIREGPQVVGFGCVERLLS